ncbi:hypothetical protein ACQP3F_30775, partial [Escherichia coli]
PGETSSSKSSSQDKLLMSWVLATSTASVGHSPEQLIIFFANIKNIVFRSIAYRVKDKLLEFSFSKSALLLLGKR